MANNSSKRNFALLIGYGMVGVILLTIFSAIFGISSFFGLKNGEKSTNLSDFSKVFDAKSIDISRFSGTLYIEIGEEMAVEGSNLPSDFSCKMAGDTLEIKADVDVNYWVNHALKDGFKSRRPVLIITLPQAFVAESFKIDFGAGELVADRVSAKNFELQAGAGEIEIAELFAEKCTIDSGAGETIIRDGELAETKINAGIGSAEITAKLIGNCTVKNGIGETDLNIIGNKNDYYIVCSNGIGNIEIDGANLSNGSLGDKGAAHTVRVENGIGDIDIKFIR